MGAEVSNITVSYIKGYLDYCIQRIHTNLLHSVTNIKQFVQETLIWQ